MQHDTLLERIRGEFLEMPGLRLTLDQAQRLCGVERSVCKATLDMLVESKFLCVKANGSYGRLTDGTVDRMRVREGGIGRASNCLLKASPT